MAGGGGGGGGTAPGWRRSGIPFIPMHILLGVGDLELLRRRRGELGRWLGRRFLRARAAAAGGDVSEARVHAQNGRTQSTSKIDAREQPVSVSRRTTSHRPKWHSS